MSFRTNDKVRVHLGADDYVEGYISKAYGEFRELTGDKDFVFVHISSEDFDKHYTKYNSNLFNFNGESFSSRGYKNPGNIAGGCIFYTRDGEKDKSIERVDDVLELCDKVIKKYENK